MHFCLWLCYLVGLTMAVSEPSPPGGNDEGGQFDYLGDIELGTPEPESSMPGEPINPDDFMRADQMTIEAPLRDALNGDPIEMAGLFEGDIAGVGHESLHKGLLKNAIKDMNMRWDGGLIPYVISATFPQYERSVIAKAFKEYENKTCIRFIPRSNQRDYINIYPGSGCSSNVGRTTGNQPVSLGSGCLYVGIVIHELMHAAGFWHEQSRTDRDDHITINWNNIQSEMQYNFQKYTQDRIQYLNAPYDTGSIMHYDAYAFAKDRTQPTIIPKKQNEKLGQRMGFSKVDLYKLNQLYKCVDDSNQVIPTTSAPLVTPEVPGECSDTNKHCGAWAASGECEQNAAWMLIGCRKSCKKCNQECSDANVFCGKWAERGECSKNGEYMNIYCAKSCGNCTNRDHAEQHNVCEDHNRYCAAWATRGQCDVNPDYMMSYCKKACGAC